MGMFKQAKSENRSEEAQRAKDEGHTIFVVQIRGASMHSPKLSRPIQDVAEQIEAIEGEGWKLDKMDSFAYSDNVTVVCLFRLA